MRCVTAFVRRCLSSATRAAEAAGAPSAGSRRVTAIQGDLGGGRNLSDFNDPPWLTACSIEGKLMRRVCVLVFLLALCATAPAATLQFLTLDEMSAQSTAIVRGSVIGSHTITRGPVLYTVYTLHVTEALKGRAGQTIDIAVPGGVANGIQQTYAGAPPLLAGVDYIIFAWQSKSGLNLIIGLSQGLFVVDSANKATDVEVLQAATTELMLSPHGGRMKPTPARMRLSELRNRVQHALRGH